MNQEDKEKENAALMSSKELFEVAGLQLQQKIGDSLLRFTEQSVQMCSSTPDLKMTTMRHKLQTSADHLQSQVKSEVFGFVQHATSVSAEESEFNNRARLLLQCHTMSAYITNCLLEECHKNGN